MRCPQFLGLEVNAKIYLIASLVNAKKMSLKTEIYVLCPEESQH
jgi:hypothetical protein